MNPGLGLETLLPLSCPVGSVGAGGVVDVQFKFHSQNEGPWTVLLGRTEMGGCIYRLLQEDGTHWHQPMTSFTYLFLVVA